LNAIPKPKRKSAPTAKAPTEEGVAGLYVLRLYVTGPSSVSARAVVNARRVCEEHLKGRYQLEIMNVADNIEAATRDQVIAAPTLIKFSPPPLKRFIGDMSNAERLMKGLDVNTTANRS
jgi:circadian clock protein KaiB